MGHESPQLELALPARPNRIPYKESRLYKRAQGDNSFRISPANTAEIDAVLKERIGGQATYARYLFECKINGIRPQKKRQDELMIRLEDKNNHIETRLEIVSVVQDFEAIKNNPHALAPVIEFAARILDEETDVYVKVVRTSEGWMLMFDEREDPNPRA